MGTLITIINLAFEIYIFIIIASVIVSWLVVFGVLNLGNPQAANLVKLINKAVAPVMDPVRRFIPSIGGIDLSPIIVIFGLMFLQNIIMRILYSTMPYPPMPL
jgi:YggT family protein